MLDRTESLTFDDDLGVLLLVEANSVSVLAVRRGNCFISLPSSSASPVNHSLSFSFYFPPFFESM